MQTIKDLLNLIRKAIKAVTNVVEETEAWTEEIVAESAMARSELQEDRKVRLEEVTTKAKEN